MTPAKAALQPPAELQAAFQDDRLRAKAYYADDMTLIFHADSRTALQWLCEAGMLVDSIITSPPFYGQRDYGVEGQFGLEPHPADFIRNLVDTFDVGFPLLRDTGSLWVNMGDTYWSGKGQQRSSESRQSARRFGLRPQDAKGDGAWCRPKQLLLIPHRFAVEMQDSGWLVRNDNIWVKPCPVPDQVRDRCSISHEHVFHFTKARWYYFDSEAVGRRTAVGTSMPPLDTWTVAPSRGVDGHRATFSEALIDVPLRATVPPAGIVLDPFAGSGTTLAYARSLGRRSIGIDLKEDFCALMAERCLTQGKKVGR